VSIHESVYLGHREVTVFGDVNGLDWEDRAHSDEEPRFKRLGVLVSRRVAKSVRHMFDSQIDFSDIPESLDEELRRARRVGRPVSGMAKQLIAIRLSPKLLSQLRKMAAKQREPYQMLIHELLERAASHAA